MRKSSLTHISYAELSYLYNDEMLTIAEIGQRFGVSEEVVRHRMKCLNIPRRNKAEARRGRKFLSARRLQLNCDQLRELYIEQGLSTVDIAQGYGVDKETVRRGLEECHIERRNKSAVVIRYSRRDFSGDLLEKAYLMGFRQGDLYVSRTNNGLMSASITVTTTSTKSDQINLFKELFTPYGQVTVTSHRNGNSIVGCHLNNSFNFLLPKQDCIEAWILNDLKLFIAYLAGYIDAEGCFCVPSDGIAIFCLQSYDVNILRQIHTILTAQLGIECPEPRLAIHKGYRTAGGYAMNNDFWRLTVKRKTSLYRLCTLLEPYIKHSKRRQDMGMVRENVIRRGICED